MERNITAEILSIGDELLYGQIQDTNSHWISQQLDRIGVRVIRRTTVGDDRKSILEAFAASASVADIILMTGGLGPTRDDLTKPLLAEFFQSDLVLVPKALEAIQGFFNKRGRELTPTNRQQAYLPEKCTYVHNPVGTAPGMWFEKDGKVWMSMPGVPHEMRYLMENFVIPKIKDIFPLPVIYHKMIKTVGIGESWLSDMVGDWESSLPPHIKLAYLPSLGEVRLRLTATGTDQSALANDVEKQIEKLLPLISKYVYGYNQDTLATEIGQLLNQRKKKLALAESCSGGYIAHLITSIAGSSDYFNGAIVPYHNTFKENILGVQQDTLIDRGAVSEETVIEMATKVREKFQADFGLSSSGIAGPGGGTADKPVGLIWIACSSTDGCFTRKLQLTEDRMVNIQLTATAALNLLRQTILKETE
jgi:nicotinamide-nucleotide amidase